MWQVLFLFLALILPSVALSTEIKDTVVVYREVKPDIYCISVSVSARGESESSVLQALSKADSYVRNLKFRYTGGKFTVFPNREWIPSEKRYRIVGFVGRINYRFLLKSPSQQEEVIRALEEAKRGAPLNYSVSSVGWCVSDKLRKRVLNELKIEALKEAESEARVFGRELRSKCLLRSINFSTVSRPPIIMESVRAQSVKLPQPPQNGQKIEVRASVQINCR